MTTDITFSMIKPGAVAKEYIGPILTKMTEAGFEIVAMKYTNLSISEAETFYAVHKERPFFGGLCSYMSSGPIVALVLRKANAVADFRTLIGATDPAKAEAGTIRAIFADSMSSNAVHGSDSDENAAIEASYFFSQREFNYAEIATEGKKSFTIVQK
jgi:nucleoside-diphosphate kinase